MKSRYLLLGLSLISMLSFHVNAMEGADATSVPWANWDKGPYAACGLNDGPGGSVNRQSKHSLYDKTIGRLDDFLDRRYDDVVYNPLLYDKSEAELLDRAAYRDRLTGLSVAGSRSTINAPVTPASRWVNAVECAGIAACAVLAYQNYASLMPHITWENAANLAGGMYLANRLAPDWLKIWAQKIPGVRRFVSLERFEQKRGSDQGFYETNLRKERAGLQVGPNYKPKGPWLGQGASLSPSLACAEYAAMGGIAYGLRNHISASNVAKIALVTGLACQVAPQCIKNVALKIPVLRRFV